MKAIMHCSRRSLITVAALLAAVGLIPALEAMPALAAASAAAAAPDVSLPPCNTGETSIGLVNQAPYQMYLPQGVSQGAPVELTDTADVPAERWEAECLSSTSKNGVSGLSFQFVAYSGADMSDLCLTATSDNPQNLQVAYLEPCGAAGTAFVVTTNLDGYLLYSRYLLNLGTKAVLSTGYVPGPYALPGSEIFTEAWDGSLPSGYYYRWMFMSNAD